MKRIIILTVIICIGVNLYSQDSSPENEIAYFGSAVPRKASKEFQFLAFYFTQSVRSNFFANSDLLKGQVVGRLYGRNATSSSDSLTTMYFEQRFLPFFIYQPHLFDGKVIMRASFEIDWTWGDASYGTGGNFGSAVAADQVNIQTQNVEVEFLPGRRWAINLGLQRMYDTPYNPYRTYFDKMTYTGYRLAYWGTDAVGISVRKDWDFARFKTGFYQLYENNVQDKDDVIMYEASYSKYVTPKWNIGISGNYVYDRADGEGGPSILSQGLKSSLAEYNGAFKFTGLDRYQADVFWLGSFFHYNEDIMMDRWVLSGFANYNFGNVKEETDIEDEFEKKISIAGLGANLRAAFRHGQTPNDLVSLDVLYASGDENGVGDEVYNGVITGNTWGTPASVFISSGAYILFPHGNVVNRFNAAVNDLSNQGYGLLGGTVNLSKDIIPYRLTTKVGFAYAESRVAPDDGEKQMGTEINGKISYSFGPFMNLELHGAYMWLGDFYTSPDVLNVAITEKPANPWTTFLVFKWLMF